MQLTLPWPSPDLSPNSRKHWAARARAVKRARAEAFYLTRAEYLPCPQPERVTVTIKFYPPNYRKTDLDNLQSRIKSYQDGIFDALGWNDRIIQSVTGSICEVLTLGHVEYTIEEVLK